VVPLSSTVKVDENLKKEIEKLQAKFTLKIGQKITQQELLRKIINFVISNEDKFFDKFVLEWNSLSEYIIDFGFETSEETINNELYGDENNSN
jgi:hypothetical protein